MPNEAVFKYSLKNDIIFKELFSKKGNDIFLKDFLTELLKLDIKKIEIIKDKTLSKDVVDEKLGILDISATLNDDTVVNIEMQMERYHQIDKRITFYSSRQGKL